MADPSVQTFPVDGDNALGEAALRMALGFSRPAIVALRVALIVATLDCLLLSVGFWFVLYATEPAFDPMWAIPKALGAAVVGVLAQSSVSRYKIRFLTGRNGLLLGSSFLVLVPLVVIMWLWGTAENAWSQIGAAFLLWAVTILPYRIAVRAAVNWAVATGLTARRAVLAGGDEAEAIRVLRGLENTPGSDVKVCAFFDDRATDRVPELLFEVPKIGYFEDLIAFCQIAEIDLVILTLPLTARDRIAQLLDQFKVLPVAVHLSRVSDDFSFPDSRGVGILPGTFHAERRITKRAFDLAVGGGALLCLSPIMLATALAVKLTSSGPIFFCQERHGFNNRIVKVWKFRSMYHDQCDRAAAKVVTKGDPRVTPVGRFIRKTSLDELPQLFNVIDGSLSLVGPRPHAVHAQSSNQEPFSELVRNYSARHRLPPGITGLAQINGFRGEIADPEQLRSRVDDDLRYIENWSLWLDMWILFRTPFALFNTKNAY